jgi:ferredoxin/flavodoxin
MKIEVVYFSPTGTTKRVLDGILEGLKADVVNFSDLRTSQAHKIIESGDKAPDLVLIGMPTYVSRIPPEASVELKKLKGLGIPAVLVAVYGNNKFGDILLEMKDIAKSAGLIPIAAAAFIGEHSFSTEEKPIAENRPDIADLKKAKSFGFAVRKELLNADANFADYDLQVPGEFPYREWNKLPAEPPETDEELCIKCGKCKESCPVDAICISDTISTNPEACIFCCACVKNCPTGARKITDETILNIRERLYCNCQKRKEASIYL